MADDEYGILNGQKKKLVDTKDGYRAERVRVIGHTPRVAASYTRAADAMQYAAGDLIGTTTTAANVVPIVFDLSALRGSGRISGMRAVITAASGTIVLPAFDLMLFRPNTSIPFAAGSYPADNAALNVSAAAMRELIAVFSFGATSWRNQAGALAAAGDHVWQDAALSPRSHAPFNVEDLPPWSLLGVMQAQNTWSPGAVAQQFDFMLDMDLD